MVRLHAGQNLKTEWRGELILMVWLECEIEREYTRARASNFMRERVCE